MKVSIQTTRSGYGLYVTSYNRTEPAGPRVLRGKPHPDVEWEYSKHEDALNGAARLQAYIDKHINDKIAKSELRKQEA